MRNVLLINFKRHGDIFQMSHIIKSIRNDYPFSKISVLAFSEFQSSLSIVDNIENVFYLDRKKIVNLLKNKIFSDGFLLKEVLNDLHEVERHSWDTIINYSNESFAAYLMNYLSSPKTTLIGTSIDTNNNVTRSNDWNILFNDVLPISTTPTFHFTDCYKNMIGLTSNPTENLVLTFDEYENRSLKSFEQIKIESNHKNARLIGIQLKSSTSSKELSLEDNISLVKQLQDDPRYVPIILIAPILEEKALAEEINNQLEKNAIIAETTFKALPSVLKNLDLLVTPDTSVKHVADLCGTSILELGLGNSPIFKQSATRNSFVLTNTPGLSSKVNNLSVNDVISSIDLIFNPGLIRQTVFNRNITLYRVLRPSSIELVYYAGSINIDFELTRSASKIIISSRLNINFEETLHYFNELKESFPDDYLKWSEKEHEVLSALSRLLLSTLRTLVTLKAKSVGVNDFLINLEKVLNFNLKGTSLENTLHMFNAKVDSLNKADFNSNLKLFEFFLYEIKTDIKSLLLHVSNTTREETSKKREINA